MTPRLFPEKFNKYKGAGEDIFSRKKAAFRSLSRFFSAIVCFAKFLWVGQRLDSRLCQ